jgi:3-dehydroquinate synthase
MKQLLIETKTKQYPLFLGEGIIHSLPEILRSLSFSAGTKLLIITDQTLESLYLAELYALLADGYEVHTYVIPSGEEAKSFEQYYACQTAALECGLDRHSLILAFGGGVVGDLAGFVAATYMRGIRYIQIPTTLLAHDSAVGGKVAINHPLGKNMIGAFHQPEAVVYDIAFLRSLPEKELRSGFAEVIKHALIRDRRFYEWLRQEIHTLADLTGERLQYCIQKGIEIKASVVREDEKETGVRAHLNFGHTLGHALESELGYGSITHGDAVALGMLFAIFVSERVYGRSFVGHQFSTWFRTYGFPVSIPASLKLERLLEKMKGDKKARAGTVRMVLLKDIGEVDIKALDDDTLSALLCEFAQRKEGEHDSRHSGSDYGRA